MFLTNEKYLKLKNAINERITQADFKWEKDVLRQADTKLEDLIKGLQVDQTFVSGEMATLNKRLADAEAKIVALSNVAQTQQEFIQLLLLHTEASVQHVPTTPAHWTIHSTTPVNVTPIDKKKK